MGISFTEKGGTIIVHEILVCGPAFRSQNIAKGDQILSIDGKSNLQGDAVFVALKGNNVPGSDVTLMIKKSRTGRIEKVVLQRMRTADIADKRKMFDIWTKIQDRARKHHDDDLHNSAQQGYILWEEMELEAISQDEMCEINVSSMQKDCVGWLTELHNLLCLGLDLPSNTSFASSSMSEGEIAALKQKNIELRNWIEASKTSQVAQEAQLADMRQSNDNLHQRLVNINSDLLTIQAQQKEEEETNSNNCLLEANESLEDKLQENDAAIQRAIHLCQQTKEYVTADLLVGHETFTRPHPRANATTVGMSFEESTGMVTGVMVGGPAFNSKKVHKGDVIVAVDGQDLTGCTGPYILTLLKGSDKPGSVVELTLKRTSVGVF